MKISTKDFIRVTNESTGKLKDIKQRIEAEFDIKISLPAISIRIKNLRRTGKIPLESGNSVSIGEVLKGTSTLYDADGNISIQWVKSDVQKEEQINAIQKAVKSISKKIRPLSVTGSNYIERNHNDDLMTTYISNDIHFGALMWAPESGIDWDLKIAEQTVKESYDYLFETSPNSRYAMILDLGDLMEVDDFKNQTPHSGNPLTVDGRYPKILKAAYSSLIYAIQKALQKHEIVYFYNIAGNHDITVGIAIREIISAFFTNEPRVIVDDSPAAIKYHKHGQTLLQFAHGDGLKMKDAGEVMAADCQDIFSDTTHRFAHFGHNHKDSVFDGRICKSESHRNLAPLNDWAAHKGFRRQLGTMKSITYHSKNGEISRSLYNINLRETQENEERKQKNT